MTESTQRGIIVPSPGQMVANGVALLALLRQLGLSADSALGSELGPLKAQVQALLNAVTGPGTVDATDPVVTALLTSESGSRAAVEGILEEFIDDNGDSVVADALENGTLTPAALDTLVAAVIRQRARVYADVPWTPGSSVYPVHPDTTRLALWGSSSAEGLASYAASTFAFDGMSVIDGGVGGLWTGQINARLGAVPFLLTLPDDEIPASGTVNVTVQAHPNNGFISAWKPLSGTLAGVPGVLDWTEEPYTYTFTRDSAGAPVPLTGPTPFLPTEGLAAADAVTLLWMGKNDLSGGADAESVVAATDAAFDWLAPLQKRVLVLGHFMNTNSSAGGAVRAEMDKVHAAHAARYGPLFIDVGDYLTSSQVWEDTMITPTGSDITQQGLGNKPPSLSADDAHLNQFGYRAVLRLVRDRMITLGWLPAGPGEAITSDAFTGGDDTNIIGRTSDATLGGAGAEWEGAADSNNNTMDIVSGVLTRVTPAAGGSWRLALPVDEDDYIAEFTILAYPQNVSAFIDLRCGASSGTPDCYRLQIRTNRQTSIDKRVSSSSTSLVFLDNFLPPAPARVGFSVKGSTLTAWVNGLPVKTVTDTAIASGPFFSMNSGGTMSGFSIDDLVIRSI